MCRHVPSGVMVRCQETRSRDKNRDIGIAILASKLEQSRRDAEAEEARRKRGEAPALSFGSQIRSYVLTQGPMVHDHRTGRKTTDVWAVLDGDMDEVKG